MKYTKEQDIEVIVSSVLKNKPKRKDLTKRLVKKYGWQAMDLIIQAFGRIDDREKVIKLEDK